MLNDAQEKPTERFELLKSPDIQDPFAFAAWLRRENPAYWNEQHQVWMLSRFEDVRQGLQSPHIFSSQWRVPFERRRERLPQAARAHFDIGVNFYYGHFQASDPPAHTMHRQSAMKAFMPLVLGVGKASLEKRVAQLLEDLERAGSCDFVKTFAYPLPSGVIFDLLGVPSKYQQIISDVSESYAEFPNAVYTADCEALERIAERANQAQTTLTQLIQLRHSEPQGDLISALVHAEGGMQQISDEDIVRLCTFLLAAGHETTVSLLAGSLRYLLQDRRQWDRLIAEPELLPGAVEELLRFVSPVLWVGRVVAKDIDLHGKLLKAGTGVLLGIGAANHDPDEFGDPETLDVTRKNVRSIAFGYGIHTCLGAALARMETQFALAHLLKRIPNVQLQTEHFDYHPSFFLRSLKSLQISIE